MMTMAEDDRDRERDWPASNEQLVRRSEFYLSPDFVDRWDEKVARMNAGKPGGNYAALDTRIFKTSKDE